MSGTPLSGSVIGFLNDHITSLLQLEALLLVVQAGGIPRVPEDISAEMYVPADAVAEWLAELAAAGFCAEDDRGYRCPQDPAKQDLLSEVAEAYVRRPVSVGRLIFGCARDDLASFSEAFRLRKQW